jgi:hypothetical protein
VEHVHGWRVHSPREIADLHNKHGICEDESVTADVSFFNFPCYFSSMEHVEKCYWTKLMCLRCWWRGLCRSKRWQWRRSPRSGEQLPIPRKASDSERSEETINKKIGQYICVLLSYFHQKQSKIWINSVTG